MQNKKQVEEQGRELHIEKTLRAYRTRRQGGSIGDNTETKKEAIRNKEPQKGEDRRQYKEERHRPYKTRSHRGGGTGDTTERKKLRPYKTRSHRGGRIDGNTEGNYHNNENTERSSGPVRGLMPETRQKRRERLYKTNNHRGGRIDDNSKRQG